MANSTNSSTPTEMDPFDELMKISEELSSLIVLYREVQGRQYRGLFREAKNRDSRDDTDYDYFLSLIDEDKHAKRY